MCIVIPLTSKDKSNPLHVPIKLLQGSLPKESFALCDQIRTTSMERFMGELIGIASLETLEQIEYITKIILDFK